MVVITWLCITITGFSYTRAEAGEQKYDAAGVWGYEAANYPCKASACKGQEFGPPSSATPVPGVHVQLNVLVAISHSHHSHTKYHVFTLHAGREGAICCSPDWFPASPQSSWVLWPLQQSSWKAPVCRPDVLRQQIYYQKGLLSNVSYLYKNCWM